MIALALLAALIATPANVAQQLAAAQPGDTVQFVGAFDHVYQQGRTFSPAVTWDFRQASAVNIHLQAMQGVAIVAPTVKARPGDWLGCVYVAGSAHISVDQLHADAGGDTCVTFRDSADVSVTGSVIDNSRTAVYLLTVDGFEVSRNTLTRMNADGVDAFAAHHGKIAWNSCSGSYAIDATHRDCIQLANPTLGPPATSDIEVAWNVAYGDTGGFNAFLGVAGDPGFWRIALHDNTAIVSQPQAVALYGGHDSSVTNNRVQTLPGAANRASVNVPAPVNVVACGNRAEAGAGNTAGTGGVYAAC